MEISGNKAGRIEDMPVFFVRTVHYKETIMTNMEKENIRNELLSTSESQSGSKPSAGIIAEQLRKTTIYRQAKQLFVSPAPSLAQIRINALVDGKDLVMPGPGLRDGFYLLKPYSIPFTDLGYATIYKGLLQYAQRLSQEETARLSIAILVTDALTVDSDGYFLGDGKGFFDLVVASLFSLGALASQAKVFAVADDKGRPDALPHDPWDIRVDGLIFPDGVLVIDEGKNIKSEPKIYWDELSLDRIKRITPLWQLYNQR